MQETENYLNTILKKRVNAVCNPHGSRSRLPNRANSTYNNITRIPVTQQKIEDVPTVFRKRDSSRNSFLPRQESFGSLLGGRQSSVQKQKQQNDMSQRRCTAERKEYLLITKRIDNKNQDGSVYLPSATTTEEIRNISVVEQVPKVVEIQSRIQPLQEKIVYQNSIVIQQSKTVNRKQESVYQTNNNTKVSIQSPLSYQLPPQPPRAENNTEERKRRRIFQTPRNSQKNLTTNY